MTLEAPSLFRVGSAQRFRLAGRWLFVLLTVTFSNTCIFMQAQATANRQPDSLTSQNSVSSQNIDQYIHQAWDTLSRSMTACSSLTDSKLNTASILYLPQGMPAPPKLAALKSQCNVRVEYLPRRIEHIGDIDPQSIKTPGLLYLPNPYVVPGGRFNEMYGWDSYFILLGLLRDGRIDLARGMVENFFFEIENYGSILNANRTYYLTRSQPPFLSSMIREVYETQISLHPEQKKPDQQEQADTWLARAYAYAMRDHALWMTDAHRAGDTGLARYFDLGEGPVPEQEDDSTYYSDVIRWVLAHPDVHTNYLVESPDQPSADEQARLAGVSCDPRTSHVCARAHVNGHWLSRDFYKGDRAMRESGYDPSFRFGPFSGSTHHYAPVCLNSLLYKYERDLAWMAEKLHKSSEAKQWNAQADARRNAINKYLWNPAQGMYFDYDFTTHQQSTYRYLTTFYPLWTGIANEQQSKALESNLHWFEQAGGLAMSNTNSGTQWDLPYGWAPTSWIAIAGLEKAGDIEDARRVSKNLMQTIETNFERDHTIREKYDVVNGSSKLKVTTGYKANVVGFGWTNAAYLEMQHLLATTGERH